PASTDAEQPVGHVRLRYQDLVNGRPGDCEGALALQRTEIASEVSDLDPFVGARVSRSLTLNGIREANELSAHGMFGAARERLAATSHQVNELRGAMLEDAEAGVAEALEPDFQAQTRALDQATGSVANPDLAAPAASAAGRAARRRVETQRRVNEDLTNPWGD
ncbi:MAG: hypothetical protein H6719_37550, partial [Sandaracinaceae bacterium]|nr:hypothetical protein [Sandaracinaceae bacterium]